MKFTDLNVPIELQQFFAKLVSFQKATQKQSGKARTRRAVRKKAPPKKDQQALKASDAAAVEIAYLRLLRGEVINERAEIAAEKRRIRAHIFEPEYWAELEIIETENLVSYPTSEPRDFIPTYQYPDLNNKPTRPTYPDGTPTDMGTTYFGQQAFGQFEDKHLSWYRITYDLGDPMPSNKVTPIFVMIDGVLEMQSSRRGCKPMRAVCWKTWLVEEGSPTLQTLAPPMNPRKVIYPRVKEQPTQPPYYSGRQMVDFAECINWSSKYSEAGSLQYAVLLVAPLPMMGKWFNNNLSVAKQWFGRHRMYRIKLNYWHTRYINPEHSWINALTKTTLGFVALPVNGNVAISTDGKNWTEHSAGYLTPINGGNLFNIEYFAIGFDDVGLAYFDWASRTVKPFDNQPNNSEHFAQGNGWLLVWSSFSGEYEIWSPNGSIAGVFPFVPSSVVECSDGVIIYAGGGTIWHLSGFENYRQLNTFSFPEFSVNSAVIAASKCCILATIAGVQKLYTGADWDTMSETQQVPTIRGARISDIPDYIEIITNRGYSIKSYDAISWSLNETGTAATPRSINTIGKVTVADMQFGRLIQHWRPV